MLWGAMGYYSLLQDALRSYGLLRGAVACCGVPQELWGATWCCTVPCNTAWFYVVLSTIPAGHCLTQAGGADSSPAAATGGRW